MPELDIIYIQVCSATAAEEKVLSSKGDQTYDVYASLDERLDSCTCPGFQYRRKCKHVGAVRKKICGWHEQASEERHLNKKWKVSVLSVGLKHKLSGGEYK